MDSNTLADVPDRFYFDRYLRLYPAMASILDAAGVTGRPEVVDFGGQVGGWAWPLARTGSHVTVVDVDRRALELGRLFATANSLDIEFAEEPPPRADAIVGLTMAYYLTIGELRTFFGYAASALGPGGVLLLNSPSSWLILEWLLTLNRVRPESYGSTWRGIKAQRHWVAKLGSVLLRRALPPDDAKPFSLRADEVLELTSSIGLELVHDPRWFRREVPATRVWQKGLGSSRFSLFPFWDWYVFVRR